MIMFFISSVRRSMRLAGTVEVVDTGGRPPFTWGGNLGVPFINLLSYCPGGKLRAISEITHRLTRRTAPQCLEERHILYTISRPLIFYDFQIPNLFPLFCRFVQLRELLRRHLEQGVGIQRGVNTISSRKIRRIATRKTDTRYWQQQRGTRVKKIQRFYR